MQAGWSIRKAGGEDVEDLIRLRLALLRSTRGGGEATPDGRPLYESVGFKPNPTSMEWTPGGE